jgi:Leucine-rich repeat (LRR) protein
MAIIFKCLNSNFSFQSSITFLEGFSSLETLILDSNHLNSNSTIPKLENLKTLSINGNLLVNIDKLLDQLVYACPALEFLSTLKNPCNPFFSERKHRYYNYR